MPKTKAKTKATTKATKYAFQLTHPYGGTIYPYGEDDDIIVTARTVPELIGKLSSLFEFNYEAVPSTTRETV